MFDATDFAEFFDEGVKTRGVVHQQREGAGEELVVGVDIDIT